MTTAQRLKTYLKMMAGGAAVATAMTLAPTAAHAVSYVNFNGSAQNFELAEGDLIYVTNDQYYSGGGDDYATIGVYRSSNDTRYILEYGTGSQYAYEDFALTPDATTMYLAVRDWDDNGANDDGGLYRFRFGIDANATTGLATYSDRGVEAVAYDPNREMVIWDRHDRDNYAYYGDLMNYNPNGGAVNVEHDSYIGGGSSSNRYYSAIEVMDDGRYLLGESYREEQGQNDDYGRLLIYDPNLSYTQNTELWGQSNTVNIGSFAGDSYEGNNIYGNVRDIQKDLDGTYLISVHDYSDSSQDDNGALFRYDPTDDSLDLLLTTRSTLDEYDPFETNGYYSSNQEWGIGAVEPVGDGTYYVSIHDMRNSSNDDQARLVIWDPSDNSVTTVWDVYEGSVTGYRGGVTAMQLIDDIDSIDGDYDLDNISGGSRNVTIAASGDGQVLFDTNINHFVSTAADSELAVTALLTQLSTLSEVSISADDQSGELGDVIFGAAVNFDGRSSKLNINAQNDIVFNETFEDGDLATDTDYVYLQLEADIDTDQDGVGDGTTGAIDINAAIVLGDNANANLDVEGRSFDNTGGAITAGGKMTMDIDKGIANGVNAEEGNTLIGAAVTVGEFGLESWGSDTSTTVSAALTTTTGKIKIEAEDGSFESTTGGTLDSAAGIEFQMPTGDITLGDTVTSVGDIKTDSVNLTVDAAVDAGGNVNVRSTGANDVNAAVAAAGNIAMSGDTFDNTGGALDATGNITLAHTGNVALAADTAGADLTSSGDGSLTVTGTINNTGDIDLAHEGAVSLQTAVDGTGTGATSFTSQGSGQFASTADGDIAVTGDVLLSHDAGATLAGDITAANMTVQGLGDFDSTASAIDLGGTGTLTLNNAGTTDLGTVNAGTLDIDNAQTITAGSVLGLSDLDIDDNLVRVAGTSDIATTGVTRTSGTIEIVGGRYEGPVASYVTLYAGTFVIDGDLDLAPGADLDNLQGVGTGSSTAPVIGSGKELEVTGTTSLLKELTIDGGTLTTGDIQFTQLLDWQSGTVNLTNADLTVGTGGTFTDQLALVKGQHLNVAAAATGSNDLTIASEGIVLLNGGKLSADDSFTNQGDITMASSFAKLDGGATLTNQGVIKGTGTIETNGLTNAAGAQVQLTEGNDMIINTTVDNSGSVNVVQGELAVNDTLTNNSGAQVFGSGSILRFDDVDIDVTGSTATAGVVNSGTIAFSGGPSRGSSVFGSIYTGDNGLVTVTGGTTVTFYGDVAVYDNSTGDLTTPDNTDEGEFHVSGGSVAVFLGSVKGGGNFTGAGTMFFDGGALDPGQSPGEMSIEGSLAFNDKATLTVEIGGTDAGINFDVLSIGGTAELAGTLVIETIDGFVASEGDVFDIINAGLVLGQFDEVLYDGGAFDVSYSSDSVSLTAVPEPTSLALFGGLLGLAARRRRRG